MQTEGEETHAYRVASRERVGCLRIGRSTRGFAKDHWAHEMLGDRVSVPRIWEIGQLDDKRAFCLSEWIPGATLQDLTAAEVEQALPAVFDAWSIIAGCDVENISGYGTFDPETQVAAHETWHGLLRAPADKAASWDSAWTAPRSGQLAELLDTYTALVGRCPGERRLVHGDWGSNNLLVADGRVAAVLDWEDAAIGDPLQDVGKRFWATWPPVTTCVTLQAAYCEARFGDVPGYRDRVLCYDLHRGLDGIGAALADGAHTWADWAFRRCLELVQQAR
ncbi:phosphotransferase [Actinopolymorpha sp. B17G11]|uniref:phosphotransferase family protein n=1 Tax=Actinopolymorpha sp. B17G11 TaxID=3160861 RepID=UPI0032E44C4B